MQVKDPIYVKSEWADLKECVYGSPDAWVLPKFLADARLRAQGEFGKFWEVNAGKDVSVAAPEVFKELSTQIRKTITILESHGVLVHVAGPISKKNRLFRNQCTTRFIRAMAVAKIAAVERGAGCFA